MGPNGVLWVLTFWCSWYTWGTLSGGVLRYRWATRGAHVGLNMVMPETTKFTKTKTAIKQEYHFPSA
jgi:hypothetical protein